MARTASIGRWRTNRSPLKSRGMTCWWKCHSSRNAKRQALGDSIEKALRRKGYTVWAGAVLKNHLHLCVRRHRDDANSMWQAFASETCIGRRLFADIPDAHPVWSERPYKVFLYTPDDVRRVIASIEQNPVKEGLGPQNWPFVTPFDGWPHRIMS